MEPNDNDKVLAKKACITCGLEFDPGFTVCPDDGTHLTSLVDDALIGTILADRYEILEVIGGGGMGLVYKARHKLMNRIVAIKMLHRHMISSADTLKRFQLEAQAASCLSLPNILTVYDFGLTSDGQPYMVMDYLEGISLADVIEAEDHLPVDRAVSIFIQCCAGLAHAHQKGVLHRDIKPSNIMLVQYGEQADFVKIVDFGIAKLLNQAGMSGELTKTGEVYGSPSYMSPEQCRGRETDARSDIYALGCVMYRALTGNPIFSGEDIIELLFKQVSEPPASFESIVPELEIPLDLEDIVFKALAKSPSDRYQSMDQFKEALEYYRDKRNLKAGDSPRPLWKRPETAPRARGASAPSAVSAVDSATGAHRTTRSSHGSDDEPRRDGGAAVQSASSHRKSSEPGSTTTAASATRDSQDDRRTGEHQEVASRSALRRKLSSDNKALFIAIGGVALTAVAAIVFVWQTSKSTLPPLDDTQVTPPVVVAPEKKPSEEVKPAPAPGGDPESYMSAGRSAMDQQDFGKARDNFQNAATTSEKKYGKKSAELADALTSLSGALIALNNYSDAEKRAGDAIAIREQKSGPNNQELVGDLRNLGTIYRRTKRLPLAETTIKRAIGIQEKAAGKNDLTVGDLDFQLAQIYRDGADEKNALLLSNQALAIKQASLGADNPQLSEIRTFIAGKGGAPGKTPTPATPPNTVTGNKVPPATAPPAKVPVEKAPPEGATGTETTPDSKPESSQHPAHETHQHHGHGHTSRPVSGAPHRRAYSSYH